MTDSGTNNPEDTKTSSAAPPGNNNPKTELLIGFIVGGRHST